MQSVIAIVSHGAVGGCGCVQPPWFGLVNVDGDGVVDGGWSLWVCGWGFAQPGELWFPVLVLPQVFISSSPIHTPGGLQLPPLLDPFQDQ